jgi:hypothetical protein
MPKVLELSFDIDINQTEGELKKSIIDIIVENENSFMPCMERICSQYDMRAEVSEGSLKVVEIDLNQQGSKLFSGLVSVNYDWSSYYGCKDKRGADTVDDTWDYSISNAKLLFRFNIPEERNDDI